LLTAMNFLGVEGYNMQKTCEFIVKNSLRKTTELSEDDTSWRY
jgi:hypothetical protein